MHTSAHYTESRLSIGVSPQCEIPVTPLHFMYIGLVRVENRWYDLQGNYSQDASLAMHREPLDRRLCEYLANIFRSFGLLYTIYHLAHVPRHAACLITCPLSSAHLFASILLSNVISVTPAVFVSCVYWNKHPVDATVKKFSVISRCLCRPIKDNSVFISVLIMVRTVVG